MLQRLNPCHAHKRSGLSSRLVARPGPALAVRVFGARTSGWKVCVCVCVFTNKVKINTQMNGQEKKLKIKQNLLSRREEQKLGGQGPPRVMEGCALGCRQPLCCHFPSDPLGRGLAASSASP